MPYIEPNLKAFESQTTSQFREDGVLERIAQCLGIERGTFFEFGIGPVAGRDPMEGLEGNFVLLRRKGWQGVFLDGSDYPPEWGVRREFITALNINTLYRKHNLPEDLDFMSIDVDGQELWIWMALQYRPKLVVLEYNAAQGKDASTSIPFNVNHVWDGTNWHGSSLRALNKLAKDKAYTLVWANGVNGIFLRDDLISNKQDFDFETLYSDGPTNAPDPHNRPWIPI